MSAINFTVYLILRLQPVMDCVATLEMTVLCNVISGFLDHMVTLLLSNLGRHIQMSPIL